MKLTKRANTAVFALFCAVLRNRSTATRKSNPFEIHPAKQDFVARAISSTKGGFHPPKADLIA
jgi:hypothetical protein